MDARGRSHPTMGRGMTFVRLTWPERLANTADALYIEAMPVDAEADEGEWFPVEVRPPGTSTCVLAYRANADARTAKSNKWTVKFRMVPGKSTPFGS